MKKIALILILISLVFNNNISQNNKLSLNTINILPPEILCKIFTYVNKEQSLKEAITNFKRLSIINKQWKNITQTKCAQKIFLENSIKKFTISKFRELFKESIIKSEVNIKLIKFLIKLHKLQDNKLINFNIKSTKIYKDAYFELENILHKTYKANFISKNELRKFANKMAYNITPIHLAAVCGYYDIVEMLLNYKANISTENGNGWNLLMYAIIGGNFQIVKLLLDKNINSTDILNKDVRSIFRIVILRNDIKIVDILLKKGLDNIAIPDVNGESELMFASRNKRAEIVKILLKVNNINAQDNYGRTALILASSNFNGLKVIKILLDHGADLNIQDNYGDTALLKSIFSYKAEIVKVLLDKGADPEIRDNKGRTAFLKSIFCSIEILIGLIKAGVDINAQDSMGNTALILFAQQNNVKMVEILLYYNANVNIQNNNGHTAISLCNNLKIVKMLINKGANSSEIINTTSICTLI